MIKRWSAIRREPTANARGGEGVTVFDHILEKSELKTNCRMFTRITLEPGASIGPHSHAREEDIYYILSGIATVYDNGETHTIYPGDVAWVGDGGSHGIANNEKTPLEFISVILTYDAPER